MASQLEVLKQHLLASWTYLDVLALAMARAKHTRFTADPEKWNRVISDLQDRTPDLLIGVFFDRREPTAPYSEQVESFFRVMARSGALSLGNPSYQVYEMKPDAKLDIQSKQGPRLEDHDQVINQMAEEIDRQLAVV